jgi:hypothetical protein
MPGFILLSSGNEVYRPDSFTVDPTMPFKFPRFQSYDFNLNDDLLDLPSLQFGYFKKFERKLGFQDVAGDSPVYTLDDIIP